MVGENAKAAVPELVKAVSKDNKRAQTKAAELLRQVVRGAGEPAVESIVALADQLEAKTMRAKRTRRCKAQSC